MVGIAGVKDFSVRKANHFNAPEPASSLRATKDGLDALVEPTWGTNTLPLWRTRSTCSSAWPYSGIDRRSARLQPSIKFRPNG